MSVKEEEATNGIFFASVPSTTITVLEKRETLQQLREELIRETGVSTLVNILTPLPGEQCKLRIVIDTADSKKVLDWLEKHANNRICRNR